MKSFCLIIAIFLLMSCDNSTKVDTKKHNSKTVDLLNTLTDFELTFWLHNTGRWDGHKVFKAPYYGTLKDGLPSGKGRCELYYGKKVDTYEGEWKEGLPYGKGIYTYADGSKVIGQFKNISATGSKNTYIFGPKSDNPGDKYIGEMKSEYFSGKGTYIWANGDKYIGQFAYDLQQGQGTKTWIDGSKYVGQWKDDYCHGQGTYYYANGDIRYKGKWKKGKFVEKDWKLPPKEILQKRVTTPSITPSSLFRPTFKTKIGNTTAGIAFAVKLKEQKRAIMLTALHLLGPDGGLSKKIPLSKLSDFVSNIVVRELFSQKIVFKLEKPMIPIKMANKNTPGDMASFWGPAMDLVKPLSLAKKLPLTGEFVWLAALILDKSLQKQQLHRAVVDSYDKGKGEFYYCFENPNITLRATSGAPVLNSKGEVVGINLGGGRDRYGKYGYGNVVTNFNKPLIKAIFNRK